MDKCQDLLKTIQEESKKRGLPTFLEREFNILNGDAKAENSYEIRLLQWNVLAQGRFLDNIKSSNLIPCFVFLLDIYEFG